MADGSAPMPGFLVRLFIRLGLAPPEIPAASASVRCVPDAPGNRVGVFENRSDVFQNRLLIFQNKSDVFSGGSPVLKTMLLRGRGAGGALPGAAYQVGRLIIGMPGIAFSRLVFLPRLQQGRQATRKTVVAHRTQNAVCIMSFWLYAVWAWLMSVIVQDSS